MSMSKTETKAVEWEIVSYDDSGMLPRDVKKYSFDNLFAFELTLESLKEQGRACITIAYDAKGQLLY